MITTSGGLLRKYIPARWQLFPFRCLISCGTSRKRAIILFPPTLMSKHMLPAYIRAEYSLLTLNDSSQSNSRPLKGMVWGKGNLARSVTRINIVTREGGNGVDESLRLGSGNINVFLSWRRSHLAHQDPRFVHLLRRINLQTPPGGTQAEAFFTMARAASVSLSETSKTV